MKNPISFLKHNFLSFRSYSTLFITLFVIILFLSSCDSRSTTSPAATGEPFSPTTIITDAPSFDMDAILGQAVINLKHASSFKFSSQDIRAYKADSGNEESRLIYGEDVRECVVIQSPSIKTKCTQRYRYSPNDIFTSATLYYWQKGSKYFFQEISQNTPSPNQSIKSDQLEPLAGDIYKTLVNYASEANFVELNGTIAKYILIHPQWYKLNSALGFANLALFIGMDDNGKFLENYLVDHYQNVKPPVFTIFVDTTTKMITRVEKDDKDFMLSVWEDTEKELIKQYGENIDLTKYEVLDSNSSVYSFSDFNQVEDFSIPE